MATGHKRYAVKSPAELYRFLGEGDTPDIYAKSVKLDTTHDVPYAGGTSVDGRTVYIDREFYREIKDGALAVRGMSADQLVQAIIEHEHTEKSIDDGDNPVDAYPPAHELATTKEHRFVKELGVDPQRYEAAIAPGLRRCLTGAVANPPRDLWCGPYLDDPDARGRDLLRRLRAKGVTDAFKASKIDAHYGVGPQECRDCRYFEQPGRTLSTCEKVCGLVRNSRHCEWWTARSKSKRKD